MKSKRSGGDKSAAWKAAAEEDYDMSIVECNLKKTPYERILAHNRALATAVMLREAMEKKHARS